MAKENKVQIRVDDGEMKMIEKAAEAERRTVSDWGRGVLLREVEAKLEDKKVRASGSKVAGKSEGEGPPEGLSNSEKAAWFRTHK